MISIPTILNTPVDGLEHENQESVEQCNIRKKIKEINGNSRLSPSEKQKQIFALFNKGDNHSSGSKRQTKHSNQATDPCSDICNEDEHLQSHLILSQNNQNQSEEIKKMLRSLPLAEDSLIFNAEGGLEIRIPCEHLQDDHNREIQEREAQCTHYHRKCSMYAECCKKMYPCRHCHDEEEDHSLDRKKVKVIRCRECGLIQLKGNQCKSTICNTIFADYHCNICNLWMSSPNKQEQNEDVEEIQIYHCDKCEMCLVGDSSSSQHCDECGFCMSLEKYKSHQCRKLPKDTICTICCEPIEHKMQADIQRCGHIFHFNCMAQYLKSYIGCPLCKKTLFDMSEQWKLIDVYRESEILPDEYAEWRTKFLCNDCHSITEDKFSFIADKCSTCNGYNTTRNDIIRPDVD